MAAQADWGQRLTGGLRFFLLGALSLILQTLLVRESLFAFHGGEIGLGVFFAVWLGGIAAGARCGAGIVARGRTGPIDRGGLSGDAARRAESLPDGTGILLALACLTLLGLLQLSIFRVHRAVIPVAAGGYLPALAYFLLLLVVAAPAAFLTGLLFPLGLRLRIPRPGNAYALEALGSMAGGALASLYALPRIPAVTLILLAGCALGSLWLAEVSLALRSQAQRVPTAVGAPLRARIKRLAWAAILLGVFVFLVAGGSGQDLDRWLRAARWRNLETGTEMVIDEATPYHQVTIAEREGEASLYLDGLYQGALSDPFVDSLAAALVLTQHPGPDRILLLAPALYGPAQVIAGVRGARITLLRAEEEIDRLVGRHTVGARASAEAGAAGSCGAARSAGLRRLTADPRSGVRVLAGEVGGRQPWGPPFDLIAMLHGGPAGGATNRLYTQEFFAACARVLAPGGVLALRLAGAANVASPEIERMRGAVFSALEREFSEVRITPGRTHYLFAAQSSAVGQSPLSWNPDTLAARRARMWPGPAPWTAQFFAVQLPVERLRGLQAHIAARVAEGVAPNRDLRPHVYYEQIRRWDRFSGSRLSTLLEGWHARPWRWSLAFLGLLAIVASLLHRRHGPALVSLASTGMAGMGANLMILLLYQTHRGTLYLEVGLIIALFMLGLALGAHLAGRARRCGKRWGALAGSDLLWVVFLLAMVPLLGCLPGAGSGASLFLGIAALVSGALTALPFPWVVARLTETSGGRLRPGASRSPDVSLAVAGGLADAADHAGALCGALVTGVFLVPLLGFPGTLLTLAALKALSALSWLWPRR
ncbi:MAG: hypothetical protein KAY32_00485 [Candidatus Eisenbacteria sp.]|nr:hypothetical protein [Candidatus Eisenbacteria bacterium]